MGLVLSGGQQAGLRPASLSASEGRASSRGDTAQAGELLPEPIQPLPGAAVTSSPVHPPTSVSPAIDGNDGDHLRGWRHNLQAFARGRVEPELWQPLQPPDWAGHL